MERVKKIAVLSMYDLWFEEEKFYECKAPITALHSNEVIAKEKYDFVIITQTFVLDIKRELEEIFAGFEYKSLKYVINRAKKEGLIVKQITTHNEREQYLKYQKEFCQDKKIPMLDETELDELDSFYAMSLEGEYLGVCSFIKSADNKTVRYKYGATQHKMGANEMILWEAICRYHELGYHNFDFGGCVPTDDKESYYYRHYRFKKKFGGELCESYVYFKIKGIFKIFYSIFNLFLKIFWKGDINSFINCLYRLKIIR